MIQTHVVSGSVHRLDLAYFGVWPVWDAGPAPRVDWVGTGVSDPGRHAPAPPHAELTRAAPIHRVPGGADF